MKKNLNDLEFKYVDQRYDGLEAWIRFQQSEWIRLDGLLEYYLLQNVNITKEYKGRLIDESVAKRYYNLLFDRFLEKTSGGKEFDFQKYLSWQKNNHADISDAIKLLNS